MRRAGVLMPIFSLPGPFGIGVFGEEAYNFIDRISEMGFRLWQLLPFTSYPNVNEGEIYAALKDYQCLCRKLSFYRSPAASGGRASH